MSLLIANCPRCAAEQMTFDVNSQLFKEQDYGWRTNYELFCICRNCHLSTVFVVCAESPRSATSFAGDNALVRWEHSLNPYFEIRGFVGLQDLATHDPPEHVPPEIAAVFKEGSTCLSVECWNASAAMFRACVDLATRPLLPEQETEGLNRRTRRDLGLRLPWLFKNGHLPADLNGLASCIREDGNDGAHAGTLEKEDAEDILDFTRSLLERLYTESGRLKVAQQRREDRRRPKS